MGVAEAREAGTFGVLVHVGFQHDVAKLVEGTAGRTHKIYLFGVALQERRPAGARGGRSEEHTSELQSLMRMSYAVFCLQKKKQNTYITLCFELIKDHTR